MDRRREVGMRGESLAKSYLENLGFSLIAQNYRCRLGELDLVFQDRGQVVFVEVRTKTSRSFGT
ncbi:MAG TPA: YraN family protein, partial [Verrucomicrobiae bacterium]|nr:YraN family protein [Verrucomicrobiae bacterium]